MSVMPGKSFLDQPLPGPKELACRYTVLLELYEDMENISETVYRAVEEAAPPQIITERIREKMAVADKIVRESRDIAALKKTLAENGGVSREDRELVKELEERLTRAVNRMVEQENRGREIIMRRGVRVARR
ncbi:MAG: hypothetical protein ACYC9O_12095 [Candidatus Latescibacterota bacterium]